MTESILAHNSGVGFVPDIGRIIDTAGRNTGTQGHRNTANNVNFETNSEKIKMFLKFLAHLPYFFGLIFFSQKLWLCYVQLHIWVSNTMPKFRKKLTI